MSDNTTQPRQPDAALTTQAQLSLERVPYQVRKWIDIPNVKAYRAQLPASDTHTLELNPIAGVQAGDTSAVQVYRPDQFQGADGQDHADQIHGHEAVHMVQHQMPDAMTSKFPSVDPRDPYADLRLTTQELMQLRAHGDTLWDHSAEGQASLVQNYIARHEWLDRTATAQQKQDYLNSAGDYEGAGNAEFERAYTPYLNDVANLNLANREPMPPTAASSSALVPGYAMFAVSGDPADEGQAPQSSGSATADDPIDSAVGQMMQDGSLPDQAPRPGAAPMRAVVAAAATQNPDAAAKTQQLAQRAGMPVDLTQANPQAAQQRATALDLERRQIEFTNPILTRQLQDPNFAAVAHDDLDSLSRIERGANELRSMAAETDLGFINSVKPAVDAAGDVVQMALPAIAKSVRAVTTRYDWGNLGQQLRDIWTAPQTSATQAATDAAVKSLEGNVIPGGRGRNLINSVEEVPGMLAAFGLAGNVAGAGAEAAGADEAAVAATEGKSIPAILGTQAAQNTYAEARARGADQKTAVLSAVASGIANYTMMGELPAAAPAESLPELAGQWASRSAVMGTGMTVTQNALARSYDPNRSLVEGLPQSIATMAAFEGVGAMGQITDAVEASKLRKRSPEAFQASVKAMFEGDSSVRIPAEDFVHYFQEKNLDPAVAANQLGVANLEEAATAGSDLEIPKANFYSRLEPEHQRGLLPDVVQPGTGMTARQAEASRQELQDWLDNDGVAKLQSEYEQADAETQAAPEWKSVYSDLKQRYLDAGENDSAADGYARLQANAISNLAKQAGMKPDELLALHNPRIVAGDAAGTVLHQGPTDTADDASDANILHQASAADTPRGWFRMRPDGSYEIGKTKVGDTSTLIHEPAHAYLELFRDLSGRENASAGIQDDFRKISEWLGTTPEEARANGFTEEQHEKWARANEKYVRDGIAPSSDLRRAFHNFAVWLGSIYQRVTDLKVDVSPEVQGVMDRLYAREGAVERAERESGEPRVKSPEEAGWTEEQFRNYADAHGIAVDKAREQVAAELNAAAERERTEKFREEKGNVRDAVTEQLDAQPEYTAIRSLRRGRLDDGTEVKLSRQALIDQFGEDRVKALNKLHPGLYRVDGGVDADTAAEMFGYHSGEEMLRSLEPAPRRTQAIEAATRDFLVNKYGDVRYDGTLNDRARFALENNERARSLYGELRALKTRLASVEKKAADTKAAMAAIVLPPLEHYEASAHAMIQAKAMADIQPYRYLNASRKFSREAFEAAGKGDARRAFEAKNKELLNHFLFREAADAQEYAAKFLNYAKRMQSRGIQQRMGLADAEDLRMGGVGDTRDQFNWLMARYKLGPGPQPQRPLRDWAERMFDNAYEPAISTAILDGTGVKDYRSVPLSEVRELHEALVNMRKLAQLQYKVYINGKMENFAERRAALVEAMRANLPAKAVPVLEHDYPGKWAARLVRGVDVDNTRMEFLINKLDGGTRGAFHDNIWNPYQEAKGDEHALAEQVTSKILDAMDRQTANGGLRMLEKVVVDGIPASEMVTRKDLVSMALNMGNDGNLDRLTKSFEFHGWDPQAIPKIAGMVRPEEWDFVQNIWDSLKPIGERMRELERRQTGLPPTMVKVEPFTVQYDDGTVKQLEGGYYPIQHDPADSMKGYQEEAIKSAANLMEKGYVRATTSRGYTRERTGFGGSLLFDYERVLSSHLTKAIKDVTHREFMQAANKFLLDPEIRRTLRERVGPTYEQSMMPWLRAVVNDRNGTLDRGASDPRPWIEKVRSNLIRAGLTFKVSTGLEQISHLSSILLYTKPSSYMQAMLDFWKDPAASTAAIREMSPNVMRFRGEDLGRDYNTAIRDIAGKKSINARVGRLGMAVYKYNDHIWSFPLWNSVYRESLLKDPTLPEARAHALAVHDADAAVRMALGVGDPGDQAPIMRSQDMLTKWATTMFGFENLRYNIMRHDIGGRAARQYRAGNPVGAAKILTAGAIAGLMLPALQGSMATGNGPKKDENLGEWAIKRSLLFTGSTIPWARNILSQFEYGNPTMAESFLARGEKVMKGAFSDKPDKDWTGLGIDGLQFGGDAAGIPGTNQAAQVARYYHRAGQGKIANPNVLDAVVGGAHK